MLKNFWVGLLSITTKFTLIWDSKLLIAFRHAYTSIYITEAIWFWGQPSLKMISSDGRVWLVFKYALIELNTRFSMCSMIPQEMSWVSDSEKNLVSSPLIDAQYPILFFPLAFFYEVELIPITIILLPSTILLLGTHSTFPTLAAICSNTFVATDWNSFFFRIPSWTTCSSTLS